MTKRYLKTPEEVIDALQAGKKIEAGDFEYRLVGEVLIANNKNDKSWAVNAGIYSDDIPFIDEPEPLKLEVGKFYRTRGGKKAIVLGIEQNNEDGVPVHIALMDAHTASFYVATSGNYKSSGRKDDNDLVAPWEEQ